MSQVYIFKLYFLLNILVFSIDSKVWKVFHQDFWPNFVCSFCPYMLFALLMSSCSDLIIGEQSKCEAPILQLSPFKYSHTNSCQTAFILWCTERNSPFYMAELTVSWVDLHSHSMSVCIYNKRTSQPVICACTSAQLEYFLLFLVCLSVFDTNTNYGSSSSNYNLCLAQLWLFRDLRYSGYDREAYRHIGYDAVWSGTGVVQFQRNQLPHCHMSWCSVVPEESAATLPHVLV
jgi:hypothetical protein